MLLALVLIAVSVGLILLGFKFIWKDEPIEPPTTAGHLDEG